MNKARMLRKCRKRLKALTTRGSTARQHVIEELVPELLATCELLSDGQCFEKCVELAFMAGVVVASEKIAQHTVDAARAAGAVKEPGDDGPRLRIAPR